MQIRFDEIQVPKEKLEAAVEKSMQKIYKQYREKKRRTMTKCCVAVAAAAVLLTGTFLSNPSLAADIPLIGNIFRQVQDRQRYPGDYDKAAVPVKGNPAADGGQAGCTDEAGGIRMTLSEVYCDSEAMNVSLLIESEEPFPEEMRGAMADETPCLEIYAGLDFDFLENPETAVDMEDLEEEMGALFPERDQYDMWEHLEVKGRYMDEHTFAGAFRISFHLFPFENGLETKEFHWDMAACSIRYLIKEQENDYDYEMFAEEEVWRFSADTEVQETEMVRKEVHEYAPNGSGIAYIKITPYEALAAYEYDESRIQPGYERFDSIGAEVMLDADGRLIKDKNGMFSPAGYNLSKITMYYLLPSADGQYSMEPEVQEKLHDESFQSQLKAYLEGIAVKVIEVDMED